MRYAAHLAHSAPRGIWANRTPHPPVTRLLVITSYKERRKDPAIHHEREGVVAGRPPWGAGCAKQVGREKGLLSHWMFGYEMVLVALTVYKWAMWFCAVLRQYSAACRFQGVLGTGPSARDAGIGVLPHVPTRQWSVGIRMSCHTYLHVCCHVLVSLAVI